MKNAIILHKESLNYGDDIQSLAAYKLLPKVDYFLDRENLNSVKEKTKLLCNGWFMENPENWPPSNTIDPLFISMHITHNNGSVKKMINRELISYYKKHEPIGCRDRHTLRLFESIGVKAYYSGCVTLTLENKFTDKDRTDNILFVDAFNKNLPADYRQLCFDKLVPSSIKKNVEIIEQSHANKDMGVEERLSHAELLLEKYSKAHLVVTSRIHTALPSIALGTPVLFLDVAFNTKNSRNRFDGIIDYFNKMDNSLFPYSGIDPVSVAARRLHLYKYYFNKKSIDFDWENPPKNPVDFSEIKNGIIKNVNDFFNL